MVEGGRVEDCDPPWRAHGNERERERERERARLAIWPFAWTRLLDWRRFATSPRSRANSWKPISCFMSFVIGRPLSSTSDSWISRQKNIGGVYDASAQWKWKSLAIPPGLEQRATVQESVVSRYFYSIPCLVLQ
jgi:hypothetical protein